MYIAAGRRNGENMQKKKRCAALLVSAFLLLSACGAEETKTGSEESLPTLSWIVPGKPQADSAEVMKAINKITEERIGARVEIQFVSSELFTDRMTMNIAGGNDFDLCFTGYINPYVNAVQNEGFYDITEIIEESEKLRANIPDYALEKFRIDGRIYGIPNMQILTSSTGLFIQKDLAEEYGLDPESIHSLEDIEPFLAWVKENKPDIYPFKTGRYGGGLKNEDKMTQGLFAEVCARWDADGNVSFVPSYETENWNNEVRLMRDWFKKGYIRPDIADVNDDENEIYEKKFAVWRGAYKPGGEEEFNSNYEFDCIAIQLTKERISTGAPAAGTAIGRNSKNPQLAFRLLEEVNSDEELFNLISFGIEGKHYHKSPEGKICLEKNGGWLARGSWKFGNAFNSYILEEQDAEVWEQTKIFNDNAEKTPVSGWTFYPKAVYSEISAIERVLEKYSMLSKGNEDSEGYMEDYIAELNEAGLERVRKEAESQYMQWKEKQ